MEAKPTLIFDRSDEEEYKIDEGDYTIHKSEQLESLKLVEKAINYGLISSPKTLKITLFGKKAMVILSQKTNPYIMTAQVLRYNRNMRMDIHMDNSEVITSYGKKSNLFKILYDFERNYVLYEGSYVHIDRLEKQIVKNELNKKISRITDEEEERLAKDTNDKLTMEQDRILMEVWLEPVSNTQANSRTHRNCIIS